MCVSARVCVCVWLIKALQRCSQCLCCSLMQARLHGSAASAPLRGPRRSRPRSGGSMGEGFRCQRIFTAQPYPPPQSQEKSYASAGIGTKGRETQIPGAWGGPGWGASPFLHTQCGHALPHYTGRTTSPPPPPPTLSLKRRRTVISETASQSFLSGATPVHCAQSGRGGPRASAKVKLTFRRR